MGLQVIRDPLPLTEKCHHYSKIGKVPHDIRKYWHQRYDIFSFYDHDIHLTDEAWFGVTPEPVANQIAQDLSAIYGYPTGQHDDGDRERYHESMYDDPDLAPSPPLPVVVDLFAGAGGNTIAFALSGLYSHVVAIERDHATLACAQHNAAAYGVAEDAIVWVLGDCFDFLRGLQGLLLSSTSANPSTFSFASSASPATITSGSFATTSFASTATQVATSRNPLARAPAPAAAAVTTGSATATPASAPPVLPQEILNMLFLTAVSGPLKHPPSHQPHQHQAPELLLFGSPPWGGVSYAANNVFDLSTMQPYNLDALHSGCRPFAHAMYLPRNSDIRQIALLAPGGDKAAATAAAASTAANVGCAEGQAKENGVSSRPPRKRKRGRGDLEGSISGRGGGGVGDCSGKMDVVHYCVKGASKAMVAYFPAEKGEDPRARG